MPTYYQKILQGKFSEANAVVRRRSRAMRLLQDDMERPPKQKVKVGKGSIRDQSGEHNVAQIMRAYGKHSKHRSSHEIEMVFQAMDVAGDPNASPDDLDWADCILADWDLDELLTVEPALPFDADRGEVELEDDWRDSMTSSSAEDAPCKAGSHDEFDVAIDDIGVLPNGSWGVFTFTAKRPREVLVPMGKGGDTKTVWKHGRYGRYQARCPFHAKNDKTGCKHEEPIKGPRMEDKMNALKALDSINYNHRVVWS